MNHITPWCQGFTKISTTKNTAVDFGCFRSGEKSIQSMYGVFTYIWLMFMVNVGKYTIHRWYGKGKTSLTFHAWTFAIAEDGGPVELGC